MFRLLILTAALWTGACATGQTGSSGGDCFRNSQIQDWRVADDQTINIKAGARHYALAVRSGALNLNTAENFELGIRTQASELICTGEGVGVEIISGDTPPHVLPVQRVTRLPDPPAS